MTIALIGAIAVLAWAVFTFNRLIRLRQLGDNAWSDIDVQLKRRHDLIPNVVAVVQGHAGYERSTLEALVAARGRALQASERGPATRAREEDPLGGALRRVLVVAESYPELRAAASFAGLQQTLTDVEDHLQNARRYYNAVVRDFNTAMAQFPSSVVAGFMRLQPREFFGLDDPAERAVPRVPLAVLALLLAGGALTAQQRSYSIERFDARIRINRDASIDVTETVTARFVGSWNGLYRTIPVDYHTPQGLNWRLGLSLQSATDDAGRELRTEASRVRHYTKYKIWVPGAQNAVRTIVLRYRATNGLRFFDEHDELYWNITGDEWDVPIQAVSATIELPPNTPGLRAIAFNGAYGSRAQDARVTTGGDTVRIVMPQALGYREGLTAVVGWDKGVVREPSVLARAAQTLGSNWPLLIPFGVFLFALWIWWRRGRDPRQRPIAVQYEPPARMSPAEAGTLLDNSADMRDITATMVDLAVRGQLQIVEQQYEKVFGIFGGGRDYAFRRLKPLTDAYGGGFAPHERRVFTGIFAGHGEVVPLSQLQNEFYKNLRAIRNEIYDALTTHGYYTNRPDKVKQLWIGVAIGIGILLGGGGAFVSKLTLFTPLPFIVAGVLSMLILLVFSQIMPARTEAGTRALEQVLGFEEFLRRVESEHLKRVIIGHPELFDKYLPFAMAFGVERQFARAFEGIYTTPPQWYSGPSVSHFSVNDFSSGLTHLSSVTSSAMTSEPRSSGGSGFDGGGGSSGGGGGGGGGGAF